MRLAGNSSEMDTRVEFALLSVSKVSKSIEKIVLKTNRKLNDMFIEDMKRVLKIFILSYFFCICLQVSL